ncbi:MAG: 30S ribosomal protein S12 methylthiotransferase RimO [Candidatus Cloacimonadota bacterium]|nr:MAG: 30S ribosomal protein S12 methylthiotransferase RimO [Candidatus Cloacimonadota bacterium]PIE78504.1 MAG: 30S ribosomal protein S12 methylthiotransferase RimO [Candidatus Delongbacteria bacterium]
MKKIKIVTLGCSKNLVDSEVFSGILFDNGLEVSPDFEEADTIVINTCGFINSAREQSVNTILEAVEDKNNGFYNKVYVMGCMSEKYGKELKEEIPEIDGVYGLKEFEKMAKDIAHVEKVDLKSLFNERLALENDHFAYVRISDGCNHNCAYCSIPSMRGKYVSRTMESILNEVENLVDNGVKELIIIAQEINSYGLDLYGEIKIIDLLDRICNLCQDDTWVRLMYTHPPMVNEKFAKFINSKKNIVNYLDLPVEHTETEILKMMRRGNTRQGLIEKIEMLRKTIPNIIVRTSIIVGFPGETDEIFESMKDFIREVKFDRLGCFGYSEEEGTIAAELPNRISQEVIDKRIGEIMEIQQEISYKNNEKLLGEELIVLIDRHEGGFSIGRTYRDAPEIDNEVLIEEDLEIGKYYKVRAVDFTEFDIYGELS